MNKGRSTGEGNGCKWPQIAHVIKSDEGIGKRVTLSKRIVSAQFAP